MRRPSPQALAAAAVLTALAAIALVTAPPPAPRVDTYASTAYGADGYRAFAALLAREGIATARFDLRPIELDGRIDTLVSAQPPPAGADPQARTAADLGALAAWVRRGGNLLYAGRFPGLAEAETRLLRIPVTLPDVGPRGRLSGPLATTVRTLPGLGADRFLFVEQAGTSLLADGNGDIAVTYPLGRGAVTAVVDPALFGNAALGRGDAARLAVLLARPRHAHGVAAFDDGLHGALVDRPWYRALPPALRLALGIGALAGLAALIAGALPGPPPMRLAVEREPSSVEFLDALAALYDRTAARAAVSTILVNGALAGARGTPPGDDRVRRLSTARDAPPATDAELLAVAKLAYLVRKDVGNGGNGDDARAAAAGWARTGRRR